MRTLLTFTAILFLAIPGYAGAVTPTGADSFSIALEQGGIKDAIIELLTAAKKDYILDWQSTGPDYAGAPGTVATMRITNASLEDALRILTEGGNWAADPSPDGRYTISWTGEPPPPSRVQVQRASDGKGYAITIDAKTSQEEALREIGRKLKAQIFIDPTASGAMKQMGDAAPTVEGSLSAADAEQAVRYVATPTLAVRREGDTIIVSAPDLSAHCVCGQALDKNWKFCPACGKPAPAK